MFPRIMERTIACRWTRVFENTFFEENIKMFSRRDMEAAIEKVGIRKKDGISVHLYDKRNTIAITTTNPHLSQSSCRLQKFRSHTVALR